MVRLGLESGTRADADFRGGASVRGANVLHSIFYALTPISICYYGHASTLASNSAN